MESFTHLRKGTTPRRIHADLEGLKDDELGRGGFEWTHGTPLPAPRPHPVPQRGSADRRRHRRERTDPHRQWTILSGAPLLMFSNADCRISLSMRNAPAPFYVRNVDGDELHFVHQGTGTFVTEFGSLAYRPGDYVYLPKATTYRSGPRRGRQLRPGRRGGGRVPRPAGWASSAGTSRSTARCGPSRGRRGRGRRPRRVRGTAVPLRSADLDLLPARPVRRRRLAGRQLPVHLQHRSTTT